MASNFIRFMGGALVIGGLLGGLVVPPLLLVALLGGVILLFGSATAPMEQQVMEQAGTSKGCGGLLVLIALGLVFFVVLGALGLSVIGGL